MSQAEFNCVPAVVLTTQRTGSTFLVGCLNSHPDIFSAGEILNGLPDTVGPSYRGPFKQVVKLGNMVRRGALYPPYRLGRFYAGEAGKVRSFKVMYNQLARPFALGYLQRLRNLRVIHLRRENLLKVYVSMLLMSRRAMLQTTRPAEVVWLHVNPRKAVAWMRKARALHDRYDRLFGHHQKIHVTYESLFDGQYLRHDTARRICEFLGVADHPMESKLIKLNPDSLRDMVTNYDELAAAISGTEFEPMLG